MSKSKVERLELVHGWALSRVRNLWGFGSSRIVFAAALEIIAGALDLMALKWAVCVRSLLLGEESFELTLRVCVCDVFDSSRWVV